jgi:DNA-binding transcriptional regulator/RsmH inhibitor MraZ
VETEVQLPRNEPPRGMYPSRLDDKGRAKMPAAFQQYISALPEKKLFVTSLDRRIAQIYPMDLWRQNEKFFQNYRENPGLAKKMWFNASDLGIEAEMDGQGRITFPPELRRELDLENGTIRLNAAPNGRIDVFSEKIYEERKREAIATDPKDLETLESAGLN